jgi:hypothetical protein
MFLVNGMRATLRKFNRTTENVPYDDQNSTEVSIKVCPYNISQGIRFGIYTVPEATGYYIVKRTEDVRQGDQLIFIGKNEPDDETFDSQVHTVLDVQDNWLFNRVENKIVAVK